MVSLQFGSYLGTIQPFPTPGFTQRGTPHRARLAAHPLCPGLLALRARAIATRPAPHGYVGTAVRNQLQVPIVHDETVARVVLGVSRVGGFEVAVDIVAISDFEHWCHPPTA